MKISATNDILMDRFGDHRALEIMAEAGFDCVDYDMANTEKGIYLLVDVLHALGKIVFGKRGVLVPLVIQRTHLGRAEQL